MSKDDVEMEEALEEAAQTAYHVLLTLSEQTRLFAEAINRLGYEIEACSDSKGVARYKLTCPQTQHYYFFAEMRRAYEWACFQNLEPVLEGEEDGQCEVTH